MTEPVGEIRWSADGFQTKLLGRSWVPEVLGVVLYVGLVLATFCGVSLMALAGSDFEGPPAVGFALSLALIVAAGALDSVADFHPRTRIEVDRHRLRTLDDWGRLRSEVLLEDVLGVRMEEGILTVGHRHGVVEIPCALSDPDHQAGVLEALRTAADRARPAETPEERTRRQEARTALEALRGPER